MRSWLTSTVLLALLAAGLCGCAGSNCSGSTAQMTIAGPPNDTGQWTSTLIGTLCGNCGTTGGPFRLDSSGRQVIGGVEVAQTGSYYSAVGADGCMGTTSWGNAGCPVELPLLNCATPAVGGARGDATVGGVEGETYVSGHPIWNSGTVSITMDGQTVSASYNRYSTPESVALELAAAIAANSTLSGEFTTAALGSDTKLAALNGGTQYDYPWQTSCTHNVVFSSCSFYVTLQPSGSLATQ